MKTVNVVLALAGAATLTCGCLTEQLGASCGVPCPLKTTVHEKPTVPEYPLAGVRVIPTLALPPGMVIVSEEGEAAVLKGATTLSVREFDKACPNATVMLGSPPVSMSIAGTAAVS